MYRTILKSFQSGQNVHQQEERNRQFVRALNIRLLCFAVPMSNNYGLIIGLEFIQVQHFSFKVEMLLMIIWMTIIHDISYYLPTGRLGHPKQEWPSKDVACIVGVNFQQHPLGTKL